MWTWLTKKFILQVQPNQGQSPLSHSQAPFSISLLGVRSLLLIAVKIVPVRCVLLKKANGEEHNGTVFREVERSLLSTTYSGSFFHSVMWS